MTTLRVGTRGSELALTQTRALCAALRAAHPDVAVDEVVIRTHGDVATDRPFDASWPVGSFVSALEAALLAGDVDFAVHSFKDLPSLSPDGLVIAAIPEREVVHDVLVSRTPVDLDALPPGFRIGTSSPRRIAQMRRLGGVTTVPIRGNVPTRIARVEGGTCDAVVLAAAGLRRLGLAPAHVTVLPPERFVPAPAQGALAVQTRADGPERACLGVLDHAASRRAVTAERSFLARTEAGCQTPIGAWATVGDDGEITLRAQLFSDDGTRRAEGLLTDTDPARAGETLADRLRAEFAGD